MSASRRRDLAAELGVNTNTVLRSLRLLRDEGLLEFRRGRGVSVAGTPQRTAVIEKAREADGSRLGRSDFPGTEGVTLGYGIDNSGT